MEPNTWRTTVYHYPGRLPLTESSPIPCADVAFVLITTASRAHRLSGMDNYWIDEHTFTFGMWNDPQNAAWYPGKQALAWRMTDAEHTMIDPVAPSSAVIMRGVMLPSEHARAVGLI